MLTFIPTMHVLTNWMEFVNVRGVYALMIFREYDKRRKWLKILLKQIGIGK
jgi:hypothetical protein